MGRIYLKELENLSQTYDWAKIQHLDVLKKFVEKSFVSPLYVVSSGGSLTSAHVAVLLHQQTGYYAKVLTPLGLHHNPSILRDSSV
jgi:hypothetical protein